MLTSLLFKEQALFGLERNCDFQPLPQTHLLSESPVSDSSCSFMTQFTALPEFFGNS